MALTVTRLLLPAGAAALKSGRFFQKASVHTSSVRSLKYGLWAYCLGDRITSRFQKFSKIITVDGNLSSGKGELAQKMANILGMRYMPEPDTYYLDKLNGEKEPLHQDYNGMCSLEKFYLDPKAADGNSYRLQLWMFGLRMLQYAEAIDHLLTTGQGVILERSPFSNMVFLDAMFEQGYIRKECVDHYHEIGQLCIPDFLPPHVVIYIDMPAEEVQKKLKQSEKSYLQNVPLQFLKSIEDSYKNSFLPSIEEESEVICCDSAKAQDVYKVCDELELLKFDKGPWLEHGDLSLHYVKMLMGEPAKVLQLFSYPIFLPEVNIGAHKFDDMFFAFKSLPGKKYAPGFNEDVGDKYIWLK